MLSEAYTIVNEIPLYNPNEKDWMFFPNGKKTWSKEPQNLTEVTASKELLIFAQKCYCRKCAEKYEVNTIISRTAKVYTKNGELKDVNVQFCMGCGQYFMNSRSLFAYHKMYGALDFQFVLDSDVKPVGCYWDTFAPDSVLSRNGYSVKEEVSRIQRQDILAGLLTYHIAEKYEILSLLNQFIRLHESTHFLACARWQEDIQFVNQYNIEQQESAGILTMKQKGRTCRP